SLLLKLVRTSIVYGSYQLLFIAIRQIIEVIHLRFGMINSFIHMPLRYFFNVIIRTSNTLQIKKAALLRTASNNSIFFD
ncbi:MAG: hypothetical protein MI974_24445, partial [Chitinophagales bacterium]|nr:hypothetical protein [Chitinophagales bacterium]